MLDVWTTEAKVIDDRLANARREGVDRRVSALAS